MHINPKYLTPNVRKAVIEAVHKLTEMKKGENLNFRKTGKAFEKQEDLKVFLNKFYEKIKDEMNNNYGAFVQLCSLEDQCGFVSSYMGGSWLDPIGNTKTQ